VPDVCDDDAPLADVAVVGGTVAGDCAVMLDDVGTETVVDPVGVVSSWVVTPDVPVQPTRTAPTSSPMAAIARFRISCPRVTVPTL
jgi:hypothetical protein